MLEKIKNYFSYKKVALSVAILAFLFSLFTYVAVVHTDYLESNPTLIVILSLIDFILLLILVILVSRKLFSLWIKRKKESQGSRLQTRIMVMFSLLSGVPAILIAVFSTMFFQIVIESWFDKRVSTVLDESVVVAESYLREHTDAIKIRAKAMALEVDNNVVRYNLITNQKLFSDVVSSLADLNALSEAVIFNNHRPIIRSKFGASLSLEVFPEEYYNKAASGEVVVIKNSDNKIRAMVSLHSIPHSFLVVGKYIDEKVVKHVKKSQGAAHKYNNLKTQILKTQIKFIFLFLMLSMLLLLAAMYVGMIFAGKIMNPIAKLVRATKKVQKGDFSTRVSEGPVNDEIANLSRAFNLMTHRIAEQKNKLLSAYNEIDDKRKFSEAILAGVSTGIIAITSERKISLLNDAASTLLNIDPKKSKNKEIESILPEISEYIDQVSTRSGKNVGIEVQVKIGSKILILLTKIVKEVHRGKVTGYIITLDDTTELAHAQRYAAWSDVARRIAHEVKNPLTPIHLGAERIRKKYQNEVKDPDMLEKYTGTIIKHVSDIGRIIEEFSRFARMPKAVMEKSNFSKLVSEIVFSRKCVSSNIEYFTKISSNIMVYCDYTQINQMLINILKNAEESIILRGRKSKLIGKVSVHLNKQGENAVLVIKDNGVGFDEETLTKITEPYFTTRDQGTGLGLAIVKKIVDDHSGKLIMENDKDKQAVITITFPLMEG
ncbi:MAG: HAMP domain-containing protein [Alphaproteobacteria bacterium]|nr:HAMP domain-containing protein [Alphaproteobacteria bacterium]